MITRSGNQVLRNGTPWWFVGYNSFVWSGACGTSAEKMTQTQLDQWFQSMRHDGHGLVRLFFFRGWNTADLDHAVASAKANNLYLAVTLDDADGGCGTSVKSDAWFSDSTAVANYKSHLGNMVTRYKGVSQIAWFEYFNEPGYYNGQLRPFYDSMGNYARSLDPTRLFSSGTVAPYWMGDNESSLDNPRFRSISESPGVDIVTMHEYDEGEVASNHYDNVIANAGGKPVFVGEFGITASDSGAGCGNSFSSRAIRLQAKSAAYIRTLGGAGGAVWAWTPGHSTDCTDSTALNDPALLDVLKTTQK